MGRFRNTWHSNSFVSNGPCKEGLVPRVQNLYIGKRQRAGRRIKKFSLSNNLDIHTILKQFSNNELNLLKSIYPNFTKDVLILLKTGVSNDGVVDYIKNLLKNIEEKKITYTVGGSIIWSKEVIDDEIGFDDEIFNPKILIDSDENIYIVFMSNNYLKLNENLNIYSSENTGLYTSSFENTNVTILKYDKTLTNLIWAKNDYQLNTYYDDVLHNICFDKRENIVIAYSSRTSLEVDEQNHNYNDLSIFKSVKQQDTNVFLVKVNGVNGDLMWRKELTIIVGRILRRLDNYDDGYCSLQVDNDNNIIIAMETNAAGGAHRNRSIIIVSKLDHNGNLLWVKSLDILRHSRDSYDCFHPCVAINSMNDIIVSFYANVSVEKGYFNYSSQNELIHKGFSDIVMYKLDTDGNEVLIKKLHELNTKKDDDIPEILIDSNDNIILIYRTLDSLENNSFIESSGNPGGFSYVVAKLDENFVFKWVKQHIELSTNTDDEKCNFCIINHQDKDDEIILVYQSFGNNIDNDNDNDNTEDDNNILFINKKNTSMNIIVSSLNSENGEINWLRNDYNFNTSTDQILPGLAIDNEKNIYLILQSNGNSLYNYGYYEYYEYYGNEDNKYKNCRLFLIKLDPEIKKITTFKYI